MNLQNGEKIDRESSSKPAPHCALVTVTYGNRWQYLAQTLESVRAQGVDSAVVIDNASTDDITLLARERFGEFATVVRFERNMGSAGGYKAGIDAALKAGAEFMLLLDDDNVLEAGCLHVLKAAYRELSSTHAQDRLAVLAYRPDRHADVAIEMPAHGMEGNRAAFFGFDLRDVPFKIFRRTTWGRRWIAKKSVQQFVEVATAPYSGLLFHRSVPERIGGPDERFLLYADDTDFSYRLSREGGTIALITGAHLADLELSWNIRTKYSNTFDALLLGDGDFRAFYSTRNNAYFEDRAFGRGLTRRVNRFIYLTALKLRAVQRQRHSRYVMLLNAIRDGEAGVLGENRNFPI